MIHNANPRAIGLKNPNAVHNQLFTIASREDDRYSTTPGPKLENQQNFVSCLDKRRTYARLDDWTRRGAGRLNQSFSFDTSIATCAVQRHGIKCTLNAKLRRNSSHVERVP